MTFKEALDQIANSREAVRNSTTTASKEARRLAKLAREATRKAKETGQAVDHKAADDANAAAAEAHVAASRQFDPGTDEHRGHAEEGAAYARRSWLHAAEHEGRLPQPEAEAVEGEEETDTEEQAEAANANPEGINQYSRQFRSEAQKPKSGVAASFHKQETENIGEGQAAGTLGEAAFNAHALSRKAYETGSKSDHQAAEKAHRNLAAKAQNLKAGRLADKATDLATHHSVASGRARANESAPDAAMRGGPGDDAPGDFMEKALKAAEQADDLGTEDSQKQAAAAYAQAQAAALLRDDYAAAERCRVEVLRHAAKARVAVPRGPRPALARHRANEQAASLLRSKAGDVGISKRFLAARGQSGSEKDKQHDEDAINLKAHAMQHEIIAYGKRQAAARRSKANEQATIEDSFTFMANDEGYAPNTGSGLTRVQLAPYGDFPHGGGLQRFTREDAKAIVNEWEGLNKFANPAKWMGIPWYVGHPDHTDFKDRYKDGRAVGRVKQLEAGNDGLYGLVKFNQIGKELVNTEQFHGHSVNWRVWKDGGVWRPYSLKSVGFTNEPNIPVQPVLKANEGEDAIAGNEGTSEGALKGWATRRGEAESATQDAVKATQKLQAIPRELRLRVDVIKARQEHNRARSRHKEAAEAAVSEGRLTENEHHRSMARFHENAEREVAALKNINFYDMPGREVDDKAEHLAAVPKSDIKLLRKMTGGQSLAMGAWASDILSGRKPYNKEASAKLAEVARFPNEGDEQAAPAPEAGDDVADLAGRAAQAYEDGENPAAWVGDEDVWEKAKAAADKTYDREDEAYWPSVVTIYRNMGGTVAGKPDAQKPTASESANEVTLSDLRAQLQKLASADKRFAKGPSDPGGLGPIGPVVVDMDAGEQAWQAWQAVVQCADGECYALGFVLEDGTPVLDAGEPQCVERRASYVPVEGEEANEAGGEGTPAANEISAAATAAGGQKPETGKDDEVKLNQLATMIGLPEAANEETIAARLAMVFGNGDVQAFANAAPGKFPPWTEQLSQWKVRAEKAEAELGNCMESLKGTVKATGVANEAQLTTCGAMRQAAEAALANEQAERDQLRKDIVDATLKRGVIVVADRAKLEEDLANSFGGTVLSLIARDPALRTQSMVGAAGVRASNAAAASGGDRVAMMVNAISAEEKAMANEGLKPEYDVAVKRAKAKNPALWETASKGADDKE